MVEGQPHQYIRRARTEVFSRRRCRAGALDGVLRSALIGEGTVRRGGADARKISSGEVYLGNSLRGLIPRRRRKRPLSRAALATLQRKAQSSARVSGRTQPFTSTTRPSRMSARSTSARLRCSKRWTQFARHRLRVEIRFGYPHRSAESGSLVAVVKLRQEIVIGRRRIAVAEQLWQQSAPARPQTAAATPPPAIERSAGNARLVHRSTRFR